MYYELDENRNYEEIKSCLEKIFAGRCKPISEKSLKIWISEIISCNFSLNAILKATDDYLNDDNYALSLPSLKSQIKNYETYEENIKQYCPYCEGRGIVFGAKFSLSNEYINNNDTAFGCVCNNNKNKDLLVMNENPQNYHKTYVSDGYYLIFKDVVAKAAYLEKVKRNGWKDFNYNGGNNGKIL